MTFKQFTDQSRKNSRLVKHQPFWYWQIHSLRLYQSFILIQRFLRKHARVVSLGAGSAYLETILAQKLNAKVTVIDFPQAIKKNLKHYQAFNFETVTADITKLNANHKLLKRKYDLVLYTEIVEHIPEPLTQQFKRCYTLLKPKGRLLISTPNAASLMHIIKLLSMKPALPTTEKTLSKVSFENERFHRREYLPPEITLALTRSGFSRAKIFYIWHHRALNWRAILAYPLQLLIPRLRPGMIILANK